MDAADAIVAVAFLLGLWSIVIGVQAGLREIGWYRARQELRAVERERAEDLQRP